MCPPNLTALQLKSPYTPKSFKDTSVVVSIDEPPLPDEPQVNVEPLAGYFNTWPCVPAVAGNVYGAGYNAVFGTDNPALDRYNAGFTRKENHYVANVINNSFTTNREIIFGNAISGIKGYYTTATFSTDEVTNKGGLKTLFSVGAKFDSNNGY